MPHTNRNRSSKISAKTVGDCTVTELMDALTARCPACVIALQRPEDGNEVSTITLLEGNRATNLGLATLLQTMAKKKLVEAATPTVDDQPDDLSGQDQDDDDASEPG